MEDEKDTRTCGIDFNIKDSHVLTLDCKPGTDFVEFYIGKGVDSVYACIIDVHEITVEAREKLGIVLSERKRGIMEDDKLKAIEELRETYQNIQDENERFKNEDGYGQYTSDGVWLDQLLPLINKLLE